VDMQKRRHGLVGAVAAGAAGILIGVVLALTSGANAASTPSPSSGYAGTAQANDGDHDGGGGHAGESALSSSLTAKLEAEALKSVPGGTVDRVERDSGDATYEAHMTKSDGSKVTVKFDKSYTVTGVEDGMGK
jgi:hypothetical protein